MLLLLDREMGRVFGELRVHKGAILDIQLNQEGRATIGDIWKQWQTQGIPTIRPFRSTNECEHRVTFAHEQVALNDPNALSFATAQALNHGFLIVTIEDDRASYWRQIQEFPLTERTRGCLTFMLRNLPHDELSTWDSLWSQMLRENTA